MMAGIVGCTDLELRPEFADTANVVFRDVSNLRSYLAKVYASYILTGQDGPAGDADITLVNDEGFTSYIRAYWKAQELTTDEAIITWTDAGIQDLNVMSWSSENQFVRVLYYRLFLIISYANDFLDKTQPADYADYGFSEEEIAEANVYRAEARFLRAMAYWHALDLFRNVALVTTITSEAPQQSDPDELFSFIETELAEIEPMMVAPRQNEYGRADQAALWMLQAKLFLNAEVYIGQPRYNDALTALNKVLSAGYGIEENYTVNFGADNHISDELIFTLPADGVASQGYGGTTFLVNGSILTSMSPANYGVNGGWNGLRITENLFNQFEAGDNRAIFFTDPPQSLDIPDLLDSRGGYAAPKFTNLTTEGDAGSDPGFPDTDYPVFRLADAYLMYAECVLRGGAGGDEATALGYINELRERAYGDTDGNITAAELNLDFILDERSRELYFEGYRRVDLIRYGLFTGGEYLWPWKGGVQEGTATSDHLQIFPIPASDMDANPNLRQNPGYGD